MRSSVARCSMYLTYLSHTSSARMPLSPLLNPNPKIAFPSLPCRRRSSCLYLCSIRLTTLRATPNTRRCALACSRQQSNARAVHLPGSTARVPHARAEHLTGHRAEMKGERFGEFPPPLSVGSRHPSTSTRPASCRPRRLSTHFSPSPLSTNFSRPSRATPSTPVQRPPRHRAHHATHICSGTT